MKISSKIKSTKKIFGKYNFAKRFMSGGESKRILVVGALGQIGTELISSLRRSFGEDNVFSCDVRIQRHKNFDKGYFYADVRSYHKLEELIVEHRIDWLINNASLLSVTAENDPKVRRKKKKFI